jgi:hypothetical protein
MILLDYNRIARACLSALPTEITFYRNIRIFLLKHHIMGAHLDTYQTPGARLRIHDKGVVFKMNGILRAVVGANAALITEVDAVIARRWKTCFNPQQ